MKLSRLEKAHNIYSEIQKLDKEITGIEKLATTLANDRCQITLSVKNLDEEQKEANKVEIDEDGSLIMLGGRSIEDMLRSSMMSYPFFYSATESSSDKKAKKADKLTYELNEGEGLILLQGLMNIRQLKRLSLLESLEKLGVSI